MKKYLALILGVLFVLSFAASAFAIHAEIPSETQAVVAKGDIQITLGGEIRTRGWWLNNIDSDSLPIKSRSNAYYDERVRLSLDAKVAPGVEGFVLLETSNGDFNGQTKDVYVWGSLNNKPGSDYTPGSTLLINEAWIVYSGSGLFGFNSGVKIGHMPLALGEKQFFDHTKFGDDAIVFFMQPTKDLHVALLTFKGIEGSNPDLGPDGGNSHDLDAYVALATYKLDDKNTVGVNYTYLNQPNEAINVNNSSLSGFFRLKLQDLSLHANGNIAGIGYKAEADMQFGSVGEAPFKSDFKGYALMLGLNYKMDPATLRASAAYGSGQKDSSDIDEFITFVGHDQHYTLVYDYSVATAGAVTGLIGGKGHDTGIANTTYFNLGVDYAATKDLNMSLDGYILRASKTDIFGSGVSKNIGWEVDAKAAYQLAKNLTYQVDAGYLKAGNFYRDVVGEKKSATVLRHQITLSF